MNVEGGIKRIIFVISLIGVLFSLVGGGVGVYNVIKRYSIDQRVKIDPDYLNLSIDSQKRVLESLHEKYDIEPLYSIPLGIGWFGACWGVFFLGRWIVKGFTTERKDREKPDSRNPSV
jgi:hypothetical protein